MPSDSLAFIALIFLLGLRHGLDPDHIATVDGLTRRAAAGDKTGGRRAGLFFSFGHGAVVTLVSGAAAVTPTWRMPAWTETVGLLVSIVFLAGLGGVNLAGALRSDSRRNHGGVTHTARRWLNGVSHPAVAGALFAVSFDTLSQSAAFARHVAGGAGWPFAVALGLAFTLGMAATDGINGLWVSRLLARTRQDPHRGVDMLTLGIALASLLIAAIGLLRLAAPHWAASALPSPVVLSAGIACLLAACYGCKRWLDRRRHCRVTLR